MTDRWIIEEIRVGGFRGFVEIKTFSLSKHFTLFEGLQRSGKSSTLTAIEWALFGNEIAKKAVGINERKGWKVRNTNADEARVELILKKGQDTLKIVRSDKRSLENPGFYFELNGIRDNDEGKLRALLGIQLKDYFSSVHLHQEIIRALLTEEPRIRKDSLDRLLGLSELRNIAHGIKLAKISEVLKITDQEFNDIERQLNAYIVAKRSEIQKTKDEGINKGLKGDDFSESGAKQMQDNLKNSVISFSKQSGLTMPELAIGDTLEKQKLFASSLIQTVRKLRDEQPDLKRQKELLQQQSLLQQLQQAYKQTSEELQNLQRKKNDILETDGAQEKIQILIKTLESKLQATKDKRDEVDTRAGTIEEAIKYFETLKTPTEEELCPVCEKPVDDVMHLKKHLDELRANLDKDLAPINAEIEEYKAQIKRLKDSIQALDNLEPKISNKKEELKGKKADAELALKHEIKDTDDPIVVLELELQQIQDNLEKLETAVLKSNQIINSIEDDVSKFNLILKVLALESDIDNILKIKEGPEYKEVENCKSDLENFGGRVDLILDTVKAVIQANAEDRLGAAKNSIAGIFKKLADRPNFSEIEIDPQEFEILAVDGSQKVPAVSIFNQGDQNCAGLSIFLGLGAEQELSHSLGFVILDDPSQTLDSTHKENLLNMLNSLPEDRQILVCTSESGLADLFLKGIVREKKHYSFATWSATKGAQPKEG